MKIVHFLLISNIFQVLIGYIELGLNWNVFTHLQYLAILTKPQRFLPDRPSGGIMGYRENPLGQHFLTFFFPTTPGEEKFVVTPCQCVPARKFLNFFLPTTPRRDLS